MFQIFSRIPFHSLDLLISSDLSISSYSIQSVRNNNNNFKLSNSISLSRSMIHGLGRNSDSKTSSTLRSGFSRFVITINSLRFSVIRRIRGPDSIHKTRGNLRINRLSPSLLRYAYKGFTSSSK